MLFIDKTPGQYLDTAEAILIIRSWYLISSHRNSSYQVTLVRWYKPWASMLAMTLSRYAAVYHLARYIRMELLYRVIAHQDVSDMCLLAPSTRSRWLGCSSSCLNNKPINTPPLSLHSGYLLPLYDFLNWDPYSVQLCTILVSACIDCYKSMTGFNLPLKSYYLNNFHDPKHFCLASCPNGHAHFHREKILKFLSYGQYIQWFQNDLSSISWFKMQFLMFYLIRNWQKHGRGRSHCFPIEF